MSVELPEAKILAAQINELLVGKKVASHGVMDSEKLQRIGFMNRDLADYDILDGQTVLGAASGGNTVHLRLSGDANLVISPEYGGSVRYHEAGEKPGKHHLKLEFTDGSSLTIRLTSMGVVSAARSGDLEKRYTYRRDFMGAASPDSPGFTYGYFRDAFGGQDRALKPLLVGKDAVVAGLSNSAFQDVIYRARLHPRRKASSLTEDETRGLYDAIRALVEERLSLGGKKDWQDLQGKQGGYTPRMGPNMKDRSCPRCGGAVQRIAHGGGHVYLCPGCQRD
jgi:formamidopyrimidine-DNA glycosylase